MIATRGDGLLTTRRAALRVGVAPATIRSWVHRGWLSAAGLGEDGYPLYDQDAVERAEAEVRERYLAISGIDPRRLRRSLRAA